MQVQEWQSKQLLTDYYLNTYPAPGSAEELRKFKKIQSRFSDQFEVLDAETGAPSLWETNNKVPLTQTEVECKKIFG